MKNSSLPAGQSSKRKKALLISLIVMVGIAALLYFEQVAVIYVLSTVGLIVLLLVVAFADLERIGEIDEPAGSAALSAESNTKTAHREIAPAPVGQLEES